MIIKQKDGVKVGDRVEYVEDEKTYKGYVAAIDKDNKNLPFLLRLKGYDGIKSIGLWYRDWYPVEERKEEYNCKWTEKKNFKVINENQLLPIDLAKEFNRLSPKDLDDIMETLDDNGLLSDFGKKFRKEFWEVFIKE
jgi:hypothetical protein